MTSEVEQTVDDVVIVARGRLVPASSLTDLGVALGTVPTDRVAVAVVVLAFTQFVEPALRFALGPTAWGKDVAPCLPGAAGEAISGGSPSSESGLGTVLSWWQGPLLLLGYGLRATVGGPTRVRRDVT